MLAAAPTSRISGSTTHVPNAATDRRRRCGSPSCSTISSAISAVASRGGALRRIVAQHVARRRAWDRRGSGRARPSPPAAGRRRPGRPGPPSRTVRPLRTPARMFWRQVIIMVARMRVLTRPEVGDPGTAEVDLVVGRTEAQPPQHLRPDRIVLRHVRLGTDQEAAALARLAPRRPDQQRQRRRARVGADGSARRVEERRRDAAPRPTAHQQHGRDAARRPPARRRAASPCARLPRASGRPTRTSGRGAQWGYWPRSGSRAAGRQSGALPSRRGLPLSRFLVPSVSITSHTRHGPDAQYTREGGHGQRTGSFRPAESHGERARTASSPPTRPGTRASRDLEAPPRSTARCAAPHLPGRSAPPSQKRRPRGAHRAGVPCSLRRYRGACGGRIAATDPGIAAPDASDPSVALDTLATSATSATPGGAPASALTTSGIAAAAAAAAVVTAGAAAGVTAPPIPGPLATPRAQTSNGIPQRRVPLRLAVFRHRHQQGDHAARRAHPRHPGPGPRGKRPAPPPGIARPPSARPPAPPRPPPPPAATAPALRVSASRTPVPRQYRPHRSPPHPTCTDSLAGPIADPVIPHPQTASAMCPTPQGTPRPAIPTNPHTRRDALRAPSSTHGGRVRASPPTTPRRRRRPQPSHPYDRPSPNDTRRPPRPPGEAAPCSTHRERLRAQLSDCARHTKSRRLKTHLEASGYEGHLRGLGGKDVRGLCGIGVPRCRTSRARRRPLISR